MKLRWLGRRTWHAEYPLVLSYYRPYEAIITTLADNMHIVTVVDVDGLMCRRVYWDIDELWKDWEIVR